jgi:hypothetical protein
LNELTALWWDNQCAILNSRNIHTFDAPHDSSSPISTLGLDENQQDFLLMLIQSDLDGNLPITAPNAIKVYFPMNILVSALSRSNFHQRISLNIQRENGDYAGKIHVLLSHRIVPGIVGRRSLEQRKSQEQALKDTEAEKEDISHRARFLIEIEKILHFSLHFSHEIFLYCSITSPQVPSFFSSVFN